MRILIADDHGVIRSGLRLILLAEFPTADIEEATDAESVIQKAANGHWDFIICDVSMPGRSGLEAVKQVRSNFPEIPILVLSIHPEREYALRALKAGASGYLSKDAANDELIKAVRRILQGRKYISSSIAELMAGELETGRGEKMAHELLSDRELEIFKALAKGQTVSEIGERLSISNSTVSTYRARILSKMNFKSNAELTRYAIEFKLA